MNFYAGQPVRVKCLGSRSDGRETYVIRPSVEVIVSGSTLYTGVEVAIKCRIPVEGHDFCVFENHELEPILPRGLESPAEIAALYEPEPIELVYSASDGFQPGEV